MFCEQMAFFSREVARGGGVKVAKHVHPHKPTSELSLDERKKRVDAVKAKSTCRACGKTEHWANDAICEMKGTMGQMHRKHGVAEVRHTESTSGLIGMLNVKRQTKVTTIVRSGKLRAG